MQPFTFFPATVTQRRELTPGMTRITLRDPSLANFADPGFDQRIKLVLPAVDELMEDLADDPDWFSAWRVMDGAERPVIRTYTTRYVRQASCEVDIDMVEHEPIGPAARWLATAAPGDTVWLLGPNRGFEGEAGGVDFVPPEQTGRYLLVGDETAAPAIAVILEQLPADASGLAIVEFDSDADAAYLPSHPGFEVRALARSGGERGRELIAEVRRAVELLVPEGEPAAVEEIDIDADILWEVPRTAKGGHALKAADIYVWMAGEAGVIRTLRRHLVGERGIDRRTVAFMGYWREGRAEN